MMLLRNPEELDEFENEVCVLTGVMLSLRCTT